MRAKLIAIVLVLTVTSVTLLTVRQQRVQAVSDMATAIERAAALDRQLWRIRMEIGRRTMPDALSSRLIAMGPMEPMRLDRSRLRWFTLEDSLAPEEEEVIPPVVLHEDRPLPEPGGAE